MIDMNRVKQYIRIDYDEEDDFLTDLISISEIYIDSMVGENYKDYPSGVELADILQLKLIYDMYESRSTFIPNSIKMDRISNSILDKLSNYSEITIED